MFNAFMMSNKAIPYHTIPYCIYIDQVCLPVSNIAYSSVTSLGASINSVVSYICDDGHRFSDGTDIKTIKCTEDLSWNGTIGECLRKFQLLNQTYISIKIKWYMHILSDT